MPEAPWNQLLLDQLEWHWVHQLRPRLDGLADDELHWEPGPRVPTIAWRLDHITFALADRSARHFGRDPVTEEAHPFAATATGALTLLDQEYATWVAAVRA